MVQEGAHTYEFGDQGSILVIADDEDVTDHVHYSYDGGKTWYIRHIYLDQQANATGTNWTLGLLSDHYCSPRYQILHPRSKSSTVV